MQRFQRILVSVVGDRAGSAALQRAAGLARRTGAALKVIDVDEGFPWLARLVLHEADKLHETIVRQKTERLEALAASVRREVPGVTTELLRGRPDVETVREVLRGGHDLLLKDADLSDRGLFDSSDMQLLRNCPCPVWLVRPKQAGRPFERIVAAVDPTPLPDETDILHLRVGARPDNDALNAKILELATSLAAWDGAELHVVHAWDAPGEFLLRRQGIDPKQVDGYVEDMRAAAAKALDQLLTPFLDRIGKDHVHLVRGEPGEAIPRFAAAKGVDLIVMGTVARTGIAGLVIGNTAETILQRVPCSVLAVKPDGFVSPVTL
jgi:universal stress protein E